VGIAGMFKDCIFIKNIPMPFTLLDMPTQTWIESDHHILLITLSLVSLAALAVIFIYRRKKSK